MLASRGFAYRSWSVTHTDIDTDTDTHTDTDTDTDTDTHRHRHTHRERERERGAPANGLAGVVDQHVQSRELNAQMSTEALYLLHTRYV